MEKNEKVTFKDEIDGGSHVVSIVFQIQCKRPSKGRLFQIQLDTQIQCKQICPTGRLGFVFKNLATHIVASSNQANVFGAFVINLKSFVQGLATISFD